MGVRWDVNFTCPHCGGTVRVQHGHDDHDHDQDRVPRELATRLEGAHEWCDDCGYEVVLIVPPQGSTVKMRAIKADF